MATSDFKDWSDGWIKPGHYISFVSGRGVETFEHVINRELARYEWDWSDNSGTAEAIAALSMAGPVTPSMLEVTKGYDKETNENRIWQIIFGIKGQVYIYIELPGNVHRHGLPKMNKPRVNTPRVSHFTESISPYDEPSFLTEHFMMRPELDRITLEAFNPNLQAAQAGKVTLNFFISRLVTVRLGQVTAAGPTPTNSRYSEILDKLYKRLIPCRPLEMYPVQAPAEAHH